MNDSQRSVLRILIQARAFIVGPSRTDARGSGRPSMGPNGPKIIDLDALMVSPQARHQVMTAFEGGIALNEKKLKGISSVPQGCNWFAAMTADRLHLPLLMTSQLSEGGAGFVQGTVPVHSQIWMVDADPDALSEDHLTRGAEIIVSPRGNGSHVTGAAVLFERDGRTRREFTQRFPHADFFSLINVHEALAALAGGLLHKDLVDAEQAKHLLHMLESAPVVPTSRSSRGVP